MTWSLNEQKLILNWLKPLNSEKAMAPHSSTVAWKIPWTEETGRLQSMGSRRVGHGWATSLSLFTFMHWRSKWQTTPVFLPGESQGWELHRVGHDWSDLAAVASPWTNPVCQRQGRRIPLNLKKLVIHKETKEMKVGGLIMPQELKLRRKNGWEEIKSTIYLPRAIIIKNWQ